jgi:hypothetical protein
MMPTTKQVEMIVVHSSNIEQIGYDQQRETLIVQFAAGRTYEYRNVSEETYAELAHADSVGHAFSVLIRSHPEKYPYRKV